MHLQKFFQINICKVISVCKEKVLTINNYPQGVSVENKSIGRSYWFRIAQNTADFCRQKEKPKILMLGLGANSISNLIARLNPQLHQTIVEIDKFIIQACREYFNLDSLPNYRLLRADAYRLFDNQAAFDHQFDAIIVDIFLGKPPYVSLESGQPEFIKKLLLYLKPDGMIVFNRPAHTEEARAGNQELAGYLQTLFIKAEIIFIQDPRGYKTDEIIALGKNLSE